jgi:ORF6N domain
MIHELRGQRVILDSDLASLYGLTNQRLLQQYRRNIEKFPADFAYVLTNKEVTNLKMQNATSSLHGGRRKPHFASTEHGAIMAATILNSPEAVTMSIFIVRAFVKTREVASHSVQWFEKLREVELALTKRMEGNEEAINDLFMELEKLMIPSFPIPEKRSVGFRVPEAAVTKK